MDQIHKLYQLNVELEGLLRVLEQRDSASARRLIKEKFDIYAAALNSFLSGTPSKNNSTADVSLNQAVEATEGLLRKANQIEVKDQEAVDGEVESEMDAAVSAIERGRAKSAATVSAGYAAGSQYSKPAGEPIKVDEMLSRRESADLRRAFTLNDKYRFRRELFGGNEDDFNHTIDLIVSMDSFDEARNYLLGDLCWDPESDAVQDFLTILGHHFNA